MRSRHLLFAILALFTSSIASGDEPTLPPLWKGAKVYSGKPLVIAEQGPVSLSLDRVFVRGKHVAFEFSQKNTSETKKARPCPVGLGLADSFENSYGVGTYDKTWQQTELFPGDSDSANYQSDRLVDKADLCCLVVVASFPKKVLVRIAFERSKLKP